jgi:hypothetical protein
MILYWRMILLLIVTFHISGYTEKYQWPFYGAAAYLVQAWQAEL